MKSELNNGYSPLNRKLNTITEFDLNLSLK